MFLLFFFEPFPKIFFMIYDFFVHIFEKNFAEYILNTLFYNRSGVNPKLKCLKKSIKLGECVIKSKVEFSRE